MNQLDQLISEYIQLIIESIKAEASSAGGGSIVGAMTNSAPSGVVSKSKKKRKKLYKKVNKV